MSDRGRKIYIILTIAVPFLLYCGYYYSIMIGNAPYKFTEFKSLQFKAMIGGQVKSQYNSITGDYQYIDKHDSVIKTKVVLSQNQLQALHRKAAELGFWNFPAKELGDTSVVNGQAIPHYYMQLNYKRKSKTVDYEPNFNGDSKLKTANQQMINEIQKMLHETEAQQSK